MNQLNNTLVALMGDDTSCTITPNETVSSDETTTLISFSNSGTHRKPMYMKLQLTYKDSISHIPTPFRSTNSQEVILYFALPQENIRRTAELPHKLTFSLGNDVHKYASAQFIQQTPGSELQLKDSYLNGGIFVSLGDETHVVGNLCNIEGRVFQQATSIASPVLRDTAFDLRDPVEYAKFLRATYERFKVVPPKLWLRGAMHQV